MGAYIVRRLLLMIPTVFIIMLANFAVVQVVPGGPIERILARLDHTAVSATARVAGASGETLPGSQQRSGGAGGTRTYRGAEGLDPEFIRQLEHQFGFDQPVWKRFLLMMDSYLRFDFGKSYFRDETVMRLVAEKLPVSISLGLWTTLLVYLVSIPLGIAKAVRDGTRFDVWTSGLVIAGNALPAFLFAILLVVLFAGGRYVAWFPLRGIVSDDWRELAWPALVADYFWHMTLPVLSLVIGGFASLTILTKNSFLDEINKQYVVTARAKGLSQRRVLYGHVFRNAMLIVIAGFPVAFVAVLFTESLLIEVIFSLDGLGLLGFEAAVNRDYPVMFGTLYVFTLLGLFLGLVSDLTYALVDPRIDFEGREV
jgi:microcin C transport system permease protein